MGPTAPTNRYPQSGSKYRRAEEDYDRRGDAMAPRARDEAYSRAHENVRFARDRTIHGAGSLNLACRNPVPTFPQRSPPSLLTTAACGGLRSTPDCRPRRNSVHLSYSCAAPCGPAILVTQCHNRTHAMQQKRAQKRVIRSLRRQAAADTAALADRAPG